MCTRAKLPESAGRSRNIAHTRVKKGKRRLSILLLGKTGTGKSATGNTIIGKKKHFKVSGSGRSVTKIICSGWTETERHILHVIDGPGLQDTDLTELADKERACENIAECLTECPGGINAFVLVVKYADRITKENKEALDALNRILGNHWLNHYGIVVVTNAADWYADNKSRRPLDWFRAQDDLFCNIFSSSGYRCVFIDNRRPHKIPDEDPVHSVISHVETIRKKRGFYTNENFQKAEAVRNKLIVKLKEPMLKLELQENCNLLTGKICELQDMISHEQIQEGIEDVIQRANKLLEEIKHEDRDSGELATLENMVHKVLRRAQEDDCKRLKKLGNEIETMIVEHNEHMKSTDQWKWGLLGMGFLGLVTAGIATVVTGGVAGIAIGSAAASTTAFAAAAGVDIYQNGGRHEHERIVASKSKYLK